MRTLSLKLFSLLFFLFFSMVVFFHNIAPLTHTTREIPQYNSASYSGNVSRSPCTFRSNWTASAGSLAFYSFNWNLTGSWVNTTSAFPSRQTTYYLNVTKDLDTDGDITLAWTVKANNTGNSQNETALQTFYISPLCNHTVLTVDAVEAGGRGYGWTTNGTSPYLNGSDYPDNCIYTAANTVSENFTFSNPSGFANYWVQNVTVSVRLALNVTGSNVTAEVLNGDSWESTILAVSSTSVQTVNFTLDLYWNQSLMENMKIRFTSNRTAATIFYVDCVYADVYAWTLINRIISYEHQSKIGWTDAGANRYYGLMFDMQTIADLEAYVDSLAAANNWLDVLRWTARLKKLGIEREQSIRYALGNLTKSGPLPLSSGNYFSMADRDVLYSTFYYADKYNLTDIWNVTAAYNFFKDALETNSTYHIALSIHSDGSITKYNRSYDEFAQTTSAYMVFYDLGITEALSMAQTVWDSVNVNRWNEAEKHYGYQSTSGYECSAGMLLKIFSILYYLNNSMENNSRLITDLETRYLNSTWNSPQWMTTLTTGTRAYSVIHMTSVNTQRRLVDTLAAWFTLEGIYDILDSTQQQNIKDMLTGSDAFDPAWMLINHPDSLLYHSAEDQYHGFSHSTLDSEACSMALTLQMLQGISPVNATLFFPLEELHYEYTFDMDPMFLKLNTTTRILTLGVSKAGALRFAFGSAPIEYSFESSGIYQVTFNASWTGITGESKTSELPTDRRNMKPLAYLSPSVAGKHNMNCTDYFGCTWKTWGGASLDTATFYWNATGIWLENGTQSLSGSKGVANFSRTIPDAEAKYVIAWYQTANDTNGNLGNMTESIAIEFDLFDETQPTSNPVFQPMLLIWILLAVSIIAIAGVAVRKNAKNTIKPATIARFHSMKQASKQTLWRACMKQQHRLGLLVFHICDKPFSYLSLLTAF